MAKPDLSRMDVASLITLRRRVDAALMEYRAKLQKQLQALADAKLKVRHVKRAGTTSRLKGRKVLPKYRSRSGETWAGRGARPRWLVSALKSGKRIEDFSIGKSRRRARVTSIVRHEDYEPPKPPPPPKR
jgi:DNA-binding protein H-NS